MAYQVGDWTIEPKTQDSISTPKSLSVPDLSYSSDYTVGKSGATETTLLNTTGPGILPAETILYSRSRVADVYDLFKEVPASQKTVNREGVRLYHEIRFLLDAKNTVTGQQVQLPFRGWVSITVPALDLVNGDMLGDLLKRTIACAFATGDTGNALVLREARGDLDPTA